jgi:hypothetical protein
MKNILSKKNFFFNIVMTLIFKRRIGAVAFQVKLRRFFKIRKFASSSRSFSFDTCFITFPKINKF